MIQTENGFITLPDSSFDFKALAEEMMAIRQHIHRYPELAFEENETSALVADLLTEWGYNVTRGLGKTGVVGQLKQGNGQRTLGIRADMDALPIQEMTDLPYKSSRPGVMHACGHDGHTAMLLGAARYLAQTRRFSGTLNLIFQPAEERGFNSGASAMIQDGLFKRFPCDRIYAIHNLPGVKAGVFLFRDGAFLAAGDRVFVKVRGIGGHAARPQLGIDPILAASAMVVNLQSVISRGIDPDDAAVVTVSRFNGGEALNVIPEQVELGLSIRSFDETVRKAIKGKVIRLLHSTAEAYGAHADIDYIEGYPVVLNDPAATRLASGVAASLFGEQRIVCNAKRSMGSEDFAYMLQQVPGSMIRLGNGADHADPGLHTPTYDFNDQSLRYGIPFWSRLAESYLTS